MDNSSFFVSTDNNLLQVERIHRFLSQDAYWSTGIPKQVIDKAIENSLNFGLYETRSGLQIGYARVVTDRATFAWLCDVFVETEYRNQGLSKMLIEKVISHPELQNLRRFCLTTKDSHFLYEKFGFQITKTPNYWMEIKDSEVYQRLADSLFRS